MASPPLDAMISHLIVVNCPGVFLVNGIETCVGQFYDEVPKFVAGGSLVRPGASQFGKKAHKFMKRVLKAYERTGDEEDKTEFDAACARFQDLRGDFKSLHRMKYDLKGLKAV
jgi:hypothetical protein